jgi:hypothetical protein
MRVVWGIEISYDRFWFHPTFVEQQSCRVVVGELRFYALRDIEAGEEVLHSYAPILVR